MARDTSTDDITKSLIERYVAIEKQLSGWGVFTSGDKAVYPELGLPMPQEPFPAMYIYVSGVAYDWSLLHQGIRRDTYTINLRLIGGPITPNYKFVPEIKVYEMLTGVVNELVYRPFLNDPITGEAFRYCDPNNRAIVGNVGRITGYSYGEQGAYVGIEVPAVVSLLIRLGRL